MRVLKVLEPHGRRDQRPIEEQRALQHGQLLRPAPHLRGTVAAAEEHQPHL